MHYLTNQKIKRRAMPFVVFLSLLLLQVQVFGQEQNGIQPQNQPQQQKNVKEDYTKDELEQFIDANKEATKVQQKSQEEMISAIQDQGLDVQTFNQIMTAQQNPDQKPDVSDDQMEKFNKAVPKVVQIQKDMQVEVMNAIEDSGMDVNKYTEMMLAYQNSPKVQEKVHQLLDGESD